MSDMHTRAINTIRGVSIDAIQKANSGHPGLPLGAAPMAYVLWQHHLRHDPTDPSWPNRDRFVLSAGHGSMLLYSLLHLTGYGLSLEELKNFRQLGSRTPGHPESFQTRGVEATTGPLGQGCVNAVGMAIAERFLAERYNTAQHTLVDHFTYALVGDGDMMEGVSAEAGSLAGHLGLGKLIYLYDANDISLDGPTSLAFTEDVGKRYQAYGWHVIEVREGDTDLEALDAAIREAKATDDRPSLIVVKTTIGFGSPNKAGSSDAHGSPLGPEEVAQTKKALGLDPEAFFAIDDDVREHFLEQRAAGLAANAAWKDMLAAYGKEQPELAKEWQELSSGKLPANWDSELPKFSVGEKVATRKASGTVLNAIAKTVPWLLGGDADLSVSTNTGLKNLDSFQGKTPGGRNIHYGVREHAMGAIANGIAYHGGPRTFTATFFVFSDYMRPAVRLGAMNSLPVVHVWTHDSVALGEDGPTHQPVEQLAAARSILNLRVVRPADANETREAWRLAMEHTGGPTALVLTRQGLPTLAETDGRAAEFAKGAYILRDAKSGDPDLLLLATGSEVHLAMAAAERLEDQGFAPRVVSMPCWELFAAQTSAYRDSVLPPSVENRIGIEAGVIQGWERYLGARGQFIGMSSYGASAPGEVVLEHFGLTVDAVVEAAGRFKT